MTWFLKHATAAPTPAAPAVDGPTPSWGQQAAASATDFWKRRDTWNSGDQYRNELTVEMMTALAPDGKLTVAPEDQREFQDPRTRGHYLARRVGELQAVDTAGRLAGLPVTPEQFDAAVLDRRKRDFDENRAVLERGDSSSAKIVGGLGAGVVDPWNIATAPIGGGTGALRYIGTQAVLGAATELPGVVTEQGVAKDLGFKAENPLSAVAGAAVGGAVLGGVIHGAGRLIEYARGTRAAGKAARPEGVSGLDYEDSIADAVDDLRMGRDPKPLVPAPQAGNPVQAASAVIRKFEGYRDDPYWDVNAYRAGYGSDSYITADGIRHRVQKGQRIKRADAERDLQYRITTEFMPAAREAIGPDVFDQLSPNQQAVLTSLSYNYGAAAWTKGGLRGVAAAARGGHAGDVAEAIRDLRGHNNGVNAKRRIQEADIYAGADIGPVGGSAADPSATTAVSVTDAPALPGLTRTPNFFDQVTTPAGTSVDVEYRVLDLSELRAASGDLQPRDRTRISSDEQIAEIAANLDPRRLMPAPEADRGAPVIGPDMIVESGNGRVAALRRAATEHPDRYQAYVEEIRASGIDIPEGVRQPVLVAQRRGDMDIEARRAFVRENNTSGIARMSATEQARTNADYLTQRAFDAYQPGQRIGGPENTEFLRRFFSAMPQAERAPFIGKDGRLTIDGLRMVRQSMFHRAFPADDLLRLLAETESPALSGLLRMMEDIAPDWAAFRAAVDAGYVRPEFDITDQLMDMVRQIARARMDGRDGQSIIAALRDRLGTEDMFTTRDPDMTEALIGIFYKGDRARPAEATQAILQRYIADAQAVGRADMADLLGDGVTPAEALGRAVAAQDARAPMPVFSPTSDAVNGPAGELADLRGLSGAMTADGAASRSMTQATEAGLRSMSDQPASGPFGPIFRDIENDPKAAIDRLMTAGDGEVPKAMIHPLFDAPIAFVHGRADRLVPSGKRRSGFGLKHIEADHGREFLDDLPEAMGTGTVYRDRQGLPRRYIVSGEDPPRVVVVREDWNGASKNWVVTSFDDDLGDFVDRSQWEAFRVTGLGEERAPSPTGQANDNPSALFEQGADPVSAETPGKSPGTPVPALQSTPDPVAEEIAAARAAFADQPELEIRLGEGADAPTVKLSEVFDQLDRDQDLIARMTSCHLKGTTA